MKYIQFAVELFMSWRLLRVMLSDAYLVMVHPYLDV